MAAMERAESLRIERFDPQAASRNAWIAFHAFIHARAAEDDPGEPVLPDADFEHNARRQWPLWETCRTLAIQGDAVIGSIALSVRREGTEGYAAFAPFLTAWGGVLQDWRRQGVATALLNPMLTFMEHHGKTTATLYARSVEGHAFLAAIGAVQKQREVENRLPFARLDWADMASWEAAVPPGLDWEIHAGRVPLDRLATLMPVFTTLIADAPAGDVDAPPNRYDLQGYVTGYEEADRHGNEHLLVLLLDAGRVAGMCEAWWDARFPDRVSQYLTAVARPWRGRGLAKALKARMLRLVRERRPGVAMMSTYNAVVNAPMLSINARLGFSRHKEVGTYQVGRDVLATYLRSREVTRMPRRDA